MRRLLLALVAVALTVSGLSALEPLAAEADAASWSGQAHTVTP